MGRASIGDLPGFPGETLAEVESATIKVRPLPLVRGSLEVLGVQVNGLKVRLVRDKDGRENWKALPIAKVEVRKDVVVVTKTDGQTSSFRYLVEAAHLSGAEVTFEDRVTNTAFSLSDIAFSATGIEPGRPFAAEISLRATSVRPEVRARVDLSGKTMVDPEAMRSPYRRPGADRGRGQGLPVTAFLAQGQGDLELWPNKNRIRAGT
jgi:AsmA protein